MDALTWRFGANRFRLVLGDLTAAPATLGAQAVVNAANPELAGGGGVDGAIHRATGPELLVAGREIVAVRGPLSPGEAVVTPGFALCQHVIHAVGPIWHGGNAGEDEALTAAYRRCLDIADALRLTSVAFPSISTGAYGFPMARAARLALAVFKDHLSRELDAPLTAMVFLFGASAFNVWAAEARTLLGEPAEAA